MGNVQRCGLGTPAGWEPRRSDPDIATPQRDERAYPKGGGDRDSVLSSVIQDGYNLAHADDQLRNNRDIVIAAVSQNGFALQYASESLQSDREIVVAAVSQDGMALMLSAASKFRSDPTVVRTALSQNAASWKFADRCLQGEPTGKVMTLSIEARSSSSTLAATCTSLAGQQTHLVCFDQINYAAFKQELKQALAWIDVEILHDDKELASDDIVASWCAELLTAREVWPGGASN